MISKGYTLWLMPKGTVYERFFGLIKKLALENNGPVFEPHVTLLGEFTNSLEEAIKGAKELVKDQNPFTINLEEIDYQDFYFRTLFVKAQITQPLLALHEHAKALFNMRSIPPYMPHLSLLYGTYPNELKEKIITQIGKGQSAQIEVKSVFLVKGGEIKDWEIVEEFPFR